MFVVLRVSFGISAKTEAHLGGKNVMIFDIKINDMTDKNKTKYNLRSIIKGKPSPVIKKIVDSLTSEDMEEVDLGAELNRWRHNHFHGKRDKDASGKYLERISQLELAKHFFELGRAVGNKARKGE